MNKDQIAFGIDIGGTNTKMGIFDIEGKLLNFETIPTAKLANPEHFIEHLAQECEQMLLKTFNHFRRRKVVALAMGNGYTEHLIFRVETGKDG